MNRYKVDRRRRTALLCSLCVAVGLSLLSYILNNQTLFTGEDLEQYAWMEWLKSRSLTDEKADRLPPLYINVSYDRQLTEQRDEYGMPVGNTDITDRGKLLRLLKMLSSTGQYKYVFLDVRFEKGHETESDSALFAEISHMERIVVASHSDVELADSSLLRKTALSDYSATISTNFVRYEFLQDEIPSVALYAYSEMTGNSISKHGLLYTCGGKPCYNSLFVRFPVESFEDKSREDKRIYHLGSDILDYYDEGDLAVLTKDKYVVIGDYVDDMHDTYAGSKSGSVITFYAFRALMEGEHMVSCGVMLFFFAVYFCISLSLFSRRSWVDRISFVRDSKTGRFLLSFVGYGMVLTLIVVFLNIFWDITTSIALPSACFAIQHLIINYKRMEI